MADIDALITPAIPFGAIPLTEVNEAITPMASFSRAGNYMGTCGLALPAGFADNGMPLGVQLLAKPFDEAALIRIGMGYQGATEWHRQHPDLSALGI
jgi:aspartyl-tRNA(Asn)/glutamyl-tRNA(Gln) amidotransferase subunit A